MKIYNISGVVNKKGRKYFQVSLSNGYNTKLVISPETESLNVGDKFEFKASLEVKSSKYGSTFTYSVLSEKKLKEIEEQNRLNEIERWKGYVESAFDENRIYQKGLDKLSELGFDISSLNTTVEKIKEENKNKKISKYKKYVIDALEQDYIYEKGIEQLHSLGCYDLDERIENFRAKLSRMFFDSSYYVKRGHIFVDNNTCYKVVDCSYYNELCFGTWGTYHDTFEHNFITIATVLDISDTNIGKAKIEITNKKIALSESLENSKKELSSIYSKNESDRIKELETQIRELLLEIEKFDEQNPNLVYDKFLY